MAVGLATLVLAAASWVMPVRDSAPASSAWQQVQVRPGWWPAPAGLALDGDSVHVAFVGGKDRGFTGLSYGYCPSNCGEASSWSFVDFPGVGEATPKMRVDAWGRPRIGYWEDGLLKYAACDANCANIAGWATVVVERVHAAGDNGRAWLWPMDFELDAQGLPRFAYPYQRINGEGLESVVLKYAACDQGCMSSGNWNSVVLEAVSQPAAWVLRASLAFVGERPRIAMRRSDKLLQVEQIFYAECTAECLTGTSWAFTNISGPLPAAIEPDIAVTASQAHVVFVHDYKLHATSCEATCANPASWSPPTAIDAPLGGVRVYGPYAAIDGAGRPRVVYNLSGRAAVPDGRGGTTATADLHLAQCDAACTTPAAWATERLTHAGEHVAPYAIAYDGQRPRIVFTDSHTSDTTYFTWCDEACGALGARPSRPTASPPTTGPGVQESDPTETPSPTETPDPTETSNPTETPDPTATPSPTETPSSTETPSETPDPTVSPSPGGGGGGGGGGGDPGGGGPRAQGTAPAPVPSAGEPPAPRSARIPSDTESPGGVERLSGTDRVSTAVAVSRSRFAPGVAWVFVANADQFADALAGGPAAGRVGGPVLLVNRSGIPAATEQELRRLRPDRIVILGGGQAVDRSTEQALARLAPDGTLRLSGPDRYETAAAVSRTWFPPELDVVYLASGLGFADGLAGGAAAVSSSSPILLTAPDRLSSAAREEIERTRPAQIRVLGGTAAVSETVLAQVRALGHEVLRIAGADRYETAAAVVSAAFAGHQSSVFVTTGQAFADALAAVPAAASARSPMLLVRPDAIPPGVASELQRLRPSQIVILGGAQAVSETVERQLEDFVRR